MVWNIAFKIITEISTTKDLLLEKKKTIFTTHYRCAMCKDLRNFCAPFVQYECHLIINIANWLNHIFLMFLKAIYPNNDTAHCIIISKDVLSKTKLIIHTYLPVFTYFY